MFDIDKFSIKIIKEDDEYGEIEIGPFPNGFGHTIGTPLRRILLSSIPGAAITSVKVKGVEHEYATIPGVLDDLLTVLLRLKSVSLVSHSKEPQILQLSAKGKGVVKAGDIETTADVEILSKDTILTELTKSDAKLDIQMTVESGKGYADPDESKRSEVGVIPLDASYSPVKRVAMQVEKTRVGQVTDLDQVKLTIFTNGVVSPSTAIQIAAEEMFGLSNRMMKLAKGEIVDEEEESEKEEVREESTDLDISNLNLSTRLENNLLRAGYTNLTELEGMSKIDILEIKGMGQKSADELVEVMKNYKLKVSED